MSVHVGSLLVDNAILRQPVCGCELGFKQDRPAALDCAFVVDLRLFGVAGEESTVALRFDNLHRLRCLFNLCIAALAVVIEGAVKPLLEILALLAGDFAEKLSFRVFCHSCPLTFAVPHTALLAVDSAVRVVALRKLCLEDVTLAP